MALALAAPHRDTTLRSFPSPSQHRSGAQSALLTTSALPSQVQDAVKCRVVDRQEEGNGDSGGSFQNGHAQLMVGLRAQCPHQAALVLTLVRAALGVCSLV